MGWPIVLATGGPRARGLAYGRSARERVQRSMELYEAVFDHYAHMAWREVRARAEAFTEAIDAYEVQILPELEGIAEGAGIDAEDVLALNLRTEIMFGLDRRTGRRAVRECTAIAAGSAAGAQNRVILGQNWDWKPAARDTVVVLACAPHDRPGFVTVVEAGLLAKCGANEAGIGVAANALISSRDRGEPGVPFHAILRRILTSATFDDAVGAVENPQRSSSANYLIASRSGRTIDVEAAPGGPGHVHRISGRVLAHANHFLWHDRPFKDLGLIDGNNSLDRQNRADEMASRGRVSGESLRAILSDHGRARGSICVHEDSSVARVEDYVTVTSVVMDLTEGSISVTEGNPCVSADERLDVAELVARARATATLRPGLSP